MNKLVNSGISSNNSKSWRLQNLIEDPYKIIRMMTASHFLTAHPGVSPFHCMNLFPVSFLWPWAGDRLAFTDGATLGKQRCSNLSLRYHSLNNASLVWAGAGLSFPPLWHVWPCSDSKTVKSAGRERRGQTGLPVVLELQVNYQIYS